MQNKLLRFRHLHRTLNKSVTQQFSKRPSLRIDHISLSAGHYEHTTGGDKRGRQ